MFLLVPLINRKTSRCFLFFEHRVRHIQDSREEQVVLAPAILPRSFRAATCEQASFSCLRTIKGGEPEHTTLGTTDAPETVEEGMCEAVVMDGNIWRIVVWVVSAELRSGNECTRVIIGVSSPLYDRPGIHHPLRHAVEPMPVLYDD